MYDYSDIINLERPKHNNDAFSIKHPKMRREDRAKIFSPFAALNGHAELLAKEERITVPKADLSSDETERINDIIVYIKEQIQKGNDVKISVTYFVPDKVRYNEGIYNTVTGIAEKLDTDFSIIKINGMKIPFDDIYNVVII